MVGALAPFTNAVGRLLDNVLRDIRFSYLTFALLERLNFLLHKRRRRGIRPDAFVFECVNPKQEEETVQFHVAVDRTKLPKTIRADQLPPPFTTRLVIPPGYLRQDIPAEHLEPILNSGLAFSISIVPNGGEGLHLVFLALDLVAYAQPEAHAAFFPAPAHLHRIAPVPATPSIQPAAKCVVFDLDHTLWSGILLEGDVALKPGVLELLQILDSRGILFSIASKNAHEHAHAELVALGIEDYFLFPQINWGAKSDSLRRIAQNLDIGIDTLIFIDDNPFDRDEVAGALPQVEVLDETVVASLAGHPRLTGSTSAEARVRRQMYRHSMTRSAAAQEFGGDYLAFLRSCQIQLEIRPPQPADFTRISELVQRTNQLNFSGRKYQASEVTSLLQNSALEKYVLACSDKYGSYGIVGFCLAQRLPGVVRVVDLMLSCRVQGKLIEQALFHYLVNQNKPVGRLEVNFKMTNRNAPAQAVLKTFGFDVEAEGFLSRKLQPGDLAVDFIKVLTPALP
jgi:FkbH-like protein